MIKTRDWKILLTIITGNEGEKREIGDMPQTDAADPPAILTAY